MTRRGLVRLLWLVCALASLTGCEDATEIVVRVRSELPEGSIDSVKLKVIFADGTDDEALFDQLPFLAVVGPQGFSGPLLVTATASGPGIQLTSEAQVSFVSGKSLLLDLDLRERCLDEPACGSRESCRGCQGCQDITLPELTPVAHDSVDAQEPLQDCSGASTDGGTGFSSRLDGAVEMPGPDDPPDADAGDGQVGSLPMDGGSGDGPADAEPDDMGVVDAGPPTTDCDARACVRSISLGDTHACFLLQNRRMYCWGEGAEGQLGLGMPTAVDYPISRVPNFANWEQVTAEGRNTCASNDEENVFCWGQFWVGIVNFDVPQQTQGLIGSTQVQSGDGWACSVTADQAVECWGYYPGIEGFEVVRVAMPSAGAKWRALPDSLATVYLIDDNHRLWSWPNPALTLEDSDVKDAVVVGAKCVLFRDGRLRCEGQNDQGQVGNGSASSLVAAPHDVAVDGVSWQAVGGSVDATCAVSQVGDIWCWGNNSAGAMGVSPTEQPRVTSPRLVASAPEGDPYVDVEVGVQSACGVRTSSRVDCWGGNAPEAFGLEPTALRLP